MSGTLKTLRALADPTRLRIVALLKEGELSVAELQEITKLAQSRISTHLGLLSETGIVMARREGKRTYYRMHPALGSDEGQLVALSVSGAVELPEHARDELNRKRVVALRDEQAQVYFNQVAGRFDRSYGPGRSWQAFGHLLLRILPPLVVADLGSGEGLLAELLARSCKQVIAVDNSEKMVEFGARKAKKNGVGNLEFRLGDLSNPPVEDQAVDLVILSQALHHAEEPQKTLQGAFRILKPGGRVMILDLLRHTFAQAHDLYGDRWLGFEEADLHRWLESAGFGSVELSIVAREDQPPHFETLLATAQRPS